MATERMQATDRRQQRKELIRELRRNAGPTEFLASEYPEARNEDRKRRIDHTRLPSNSDVDYGAEHTAIMSHNPADWLETRGWSIDGAGRQRAKDYQIGAYFDLQTAVTFQLAREIHCKEEIEKFVKKAKRRLSTSYIIYP